LAEQKEGVVSINVSDALKWVSVALIVVVGLIHLIDTTDSLEESTFKGFLFIANFVGALVAAFGIYRNDSWGWALGTIVAVGAFLGYMISRTVGIFGLPPDEWLEPLGVLSLIVEAIFVLVFVRVFFAGRTKAG
jgi:uncharacterized membrane protein YfcA